jgi:hypothetical protein
MSSRSNGPAAVGSYTNRHGAEVTLAEVGHGTSGKLKPASIPPWPLSRPHRGLVLYARAYGEAEARAGERVPLTGRRSGVGERLRRRQTRQNPKVSVSAPSLGVLVLVARIGHAVLRPRLYRRALVSGVSRLAGVVGDPDDRDGMPRLW